MAEEQYKVIYSMMRVGKRILQRDILKDISLSYFYGAKIGVIGLKALGTVLASMQAASLGEPRIRLKLCDWFSKISFVSDNF